MAFALQFKASHGYSSADGIEIAVELGLGGERAELVARRDTGSAHCIFERRYADALGLEVETGRAQRFRTMAGSFVAYEHEIVLHTLGIEFSASVFFAEDYGFNRNFLGRSGWLDRLRIGIVDYDRLIYLSPYDS